ncbi:MULTISPECIES: hypothetical protein [unclassified Streptomyces]|nr:MULTISPECIES: hypothetical protein [unclassified Streptomyces]
MTPGRDYREVTVEYHLASRLTGAADEERVPDDDGPSTRAGPPGRGT